jgi:gliding motility-associated-like protein
LRASRTIFFFLSFIPFSLLSTASALGAIILTPTVTPISAATYNESIQLIYNGVITATAGAGVAPYTYTLTEPTYTTLPQNNPYFPWLGPGAYTLLVTDASGQTASVPLTISFLYPQPTLTVSSIVQPSLCSRSDGGFTLNAGGGTPPYSYSIDGGNTFSGTATFSNLSGGVYYALVKDSKGQLCIIGDNPTATMGGVVNLAATSCPIHTDLEVAATTCANTGGMTITVYSNSPPVRFSLDGTNFWTLPPNQFFPGVYEYDTTTGLAPGAYNTVTRDAGGGLNLFSVSIEKYCFPNLAVNVSAATCGHNDGSIGITPSYSSPPYSYTLDGVNYQGAPGFSGLAAGYYNILAMDGNGQTDNVTVFVGGLCPGVTATVTPETCANGDGSITATGSTGSPPYQYSIDGMHFQSSNTFSGLAAGGYTLTVRDNASLTGTTTATIGIDSNLTVDAGSDLTLCQGASAILGAVSNGANFSWSPTAGLDNPGALDPRVSPQTTTKYYLTATLGVCSHTDSVGVNVNPAPVADAGNDTAICSGQSVQLGGSGGQGYQWTPSTNLDQPASADPNVTRPPSTITYHLTVTAANGCPSINDAQVIVTVTPPPKAFAGKDTSVLTGEPVLLRTVDVNNSGFNSYSWSPGAGLSNPSIPNPVATPRQNITYTVLASSPDGCEASASISIKVYSSIGVFVPNAFTPNGDGHNDILRAVPLGISTLRYFSVFSRAGQRIFFTANPSEGWDGSFNGRAQNTGVYVWIAAGIDLNGHLIEQSGTVMLIR